MRVIKASFLIVLLLSSAPYCFAQDIQASSEISSVTVYPGSASISRLATLNLEKGEHSVYFSDIIPEIDENSLRVSGKGQAQVKIFGAQYKKEFLEEPYNEKIALLQDKIQDLSDYIRSLDDEKTVLAQEREFLESIKLFSGEQISKDLVTKMPQVADLENTANFLTEKLNKNYERQLEIEKEKREANKKISVLRRELSQLASYRNSNLVKRFIVVDIEAVKAGSFDLSISYLVRGVSWHMVYDARVAFEDKKVELISYGIVKQKTGEDWSDVDITLSTVKPSIGGRMPYITPWFLKPYEPVVHRKAKVAGKMRMQYAAMDKVAAMAPAEMLLDEESAIGAGEADYSFAGAQQKGTAIVYKLAKKMTIKSDGAEHKLPISSQVLKAEFQYSACPKISPFAYLGCRVANSEDLQLMAGRVNVFLEGDYVGASSIDNVGQGEKFDLYLGVDEGVKVERKEIEKKVDDVLFAGIASSNKKTFLKYKIKSENYKSDKIKLNLFEPMPVSQNDKIAVKMGKASVKPIEQDWKDRKGVWKWELHLKPKEKKEINFSYTIEHPRNIQVPGI
ncbi:mucoidy inhibitor MuiA family protein [Candidatus Omnitrophota bacterium]